VDWRIWFVQLSGWPVFLAIILMVSLGMFGLSFAFTRLGINRSVLQNVVVAIVALAVVAFAGLALASIVTRC
jgi:hypothetical protein